MTSHRRPLQPLFRLAGLVALVAAGFTTLVATGGGGGGAGPTNVQGDACSVGVASGFGGDVGWAASDGRIGSGADGKGGVGIGVNATLGPVVGATVTVTRSDGSVVGSAVTDASGRVTLTTCDQAGPYYVEAQGAPGATMFDETAAPAGATVPFGPENVLRAFVPTVTGNIGVTAFSEAAARLAIAGGGAGVGGAANASPSDKATPGRPAVAAIEAANARVLQALRGVLPDTYWPSAVTGLPYVRVPGSTTPVPDTEAGRAGLVQGALARSARLHAPTAGAPALAMARQLAADLADGALDGAATGGAPEAAAQAYDVQRFASRLNAALATTTRLHGDAETRKRVAGVLSVGAVSFGDGTSAAGTTAVRLRSDGVLSRIDAGGTDIGELAAEVVELFGASQPPASVLFVRRADGTVASLGAGGAAGLLATGATGTATTATVVAGLAGASAISVGREHALARLADATVAGWGSNARGQLGALQATRVPQPIAGLADVVQVLAIGDASFAVLGDGRVLAWGTGAGSLGQGTTAAASRAVPVPVLTGPGAPLSGVVGIAGYVGTAPGSDATLAALRGDGTVWVWGENGTGGSGAAGASSGFARQVPGLAGVRQVVGSANGFHALDGAGSTWFWGQTNTPEATPGAPRRIEALPPMLYAQAGFAGLYQTRLAGADGVRWRLDGPAAAQLVESEELSLVPPSGFATIGRISGDDVIGSAERDAGITVSGTISEANRPVTVRVGTATQVVTASGINWSARFGAAELPLSGRVTVSASFESGTGRPSAVTTSTLTIDSAGPVVTITDDVSAAETGSPVTFTFAWDKPVEGFRSESVTIAPAGVRRGSFTTVNPRLYRLVVTPPAGQAGSLTVTVPANSVSDTSGNRNAATVVATQGFRTDSTPPTVQISNAAPEVVRENDQIKSVMYLGFLWSEPVSNFTDSSISIAGAIKSPGRFVRLSGSEYQMRVEWPPGTPVTEDVVVNLAAGIEDGARNGTPSTVERTFSVRSTGYQVAYDNPGGGIGGDGAGAGGAAGDAGSGIGGDALENGGDAPAEVTLAVEGSSLRVSWDESRSRLLATTGSNSNRGLTHYLVLVRSAFGEPFRPVGTPVPIRIPAGLGNYTVRLPLDKVHSVRVRGCNAQAVANASLYRTIDLWACVDGREYVVPTEFALLKSAAPQAGQRFGTSVTLSGDGNLLAVGSPRGASGGEVSVFRRDGPAWVREAVIAPSNRLAPNARLADGSVSRDGDEFGRSLAFSSDGRTLVVGAPGDSARGTGPADRGVMTARSSGAAYVFVREGGTFRERAYLKTPTPRVHERFGRTVAITGDAVEEVVAIGAPNDVPDLASWAGAVHTFARPASATGAWTAIGRVDAGSPAVRDEFGITLALARTGAETVLAVGAPAAPGGGAAYVYARRGAGAWQQGTLRLALPPREPDPTRSPAGDGRAIALSADASLLAVVVPSGLGTVVLQRQGTGVPIDYLRVPVREANLTPSAPRPGSPESPALFERAALGYSGFGLAIQGPRGSERIIVGESPFDDFTCAERADARTERACYRDDAYIDGRRPFEGVKVFTRTRISGLDAWVRGEAAGPPAIVGRPFTNPAIDQTPLPQLGYGAAIAVASGSGRIAVGTPLDDGFWSASDSSAVPLPGAGGVIVY